MAEQMVDANTVDMGERGERRVIAVVAMLKAEQTAARRDVARLERLRGWRRQQSRVRLVALIKRPDVADRHKEQKNDDTRDFHQKSHNRSNIRVASPSPCLSRDWPSPEILRLRSATCAEAIASEESIS